MEHTATPSPSPTEEASPSAQVNKEDLKVEVLNGTGTPGQAALVKNQLSKLGYKSFVLDNFDRDDTSNTLLEYSIKVSKDLRSEIIADLKTIFKTVKSEEATEEGKFDIIITTGDTLAQ